MAKPLSILLSALVFFPAMSSGLPVQLGKVTIGLESYDGYQEGYAYISTDQSGEQLEIFISYKGFGLDQIIWLFDTDEFLTLRNASEQAAWWRARLLEIDVNQEVIREVAQINPDISYNYRNTSYPFTDAESTLRFTRQGMDYALILSENLPGAETRSSGRKILPVFTIHFLGSQLPQLRDIISESGVEIVLQAYAEQKAAIDAIITSSPN